jgi:hypothetical protein
VKILHHVCKPLLDVSSGDCGESLGNGTLEFSMVVEGGLADNDEPSSRSSLHFDLITVETMVWCTSHWMPTQKVCTDEGIGPWKGRKKGVKVFI